MRVLLVGYVGGLQAGQILVCGTEIVSGHGSEVVDRCCFTYPHDTPSR
jgi:hypothetical protein